MRSKISQALFFIFSLFLVGLSSVSVSAQKADPKDPQNLERGRELIKQAVAARGGTAYLNFQTIVSTGQFTSFDKGVSTNPLAFTDWIALPDRERTEFGKGKKKDRRIQVNVGRTGWVYDGDAQTLKDQTEPQISQHIDGFAMEIDRVLRMAAAGAAGVAVRFAGREELRPGERADVVSVTLRSGQTVDIWLDRTTHLPLSLIYEKEEEGRLVKREARFFQYIAYDGVQFPNIIDYYRDGLQESRVNFQSIKLNTPVGDELFVKPASIKMIK